jgi:ADP-heptose:LPS heptosyltransferase
MKLEKPFNILVRRRAAIGDVIMSTGVVRELKKRYGENANIDVVTEQMGIYRNNPHVRNVIHSNTPPDINNYQFYINLDDAYEDSPTHHYVQSYFYRAFGAGHECDMSTELFASDEDKTTVLNFQYTNKLDKYIVVHMRNWHWTAKNISMDVWFDVYAKLFEKRTDFKVVCVGGPTDLFVEGHPLFVDARAVFSDQQLKVLCDGAKCFVGIDSGPYWAASASSTHIVALLTHLRPEIIVPFRKWELGYNATSIQTLEDCRGCNDIQERPVRQLNCPKGNTPCNNNFDTVAIADTILAQL